MTITELKDRKISAENKIVDIINQLEKDTECLVIGIVIGNVSEEGYGTHLEITVKKTVDITLDIK
jgi:hypothetical protein